MSAIKTEQRGLAVKTYYRSEKRTRQCELSILQPLCTAIDRTLMAIVFFGSVAFASIIWMHLTPDAHLAVVRTLQALASIATIASMVWTFFGGNGIQPMQQLVRSTTPFKFLFLVLSAGVLLGSFSSRFVDIVAMLFSFPGSLICQQEMDSINAAESAEKTPTVEEYLFAHPSK
jgi:hypothetical protein